MNPFSPKHTTIMESLRENVHCTMFPLKMVDVPQYVLERKIIQTVGIEKTETFYT